MSKDSQRQDARRQDARRWLARLDAFRLVYQRVEPSHRELKRAINGDFPPLVEGPTSEPNHGGGFTASEQIDLNLCLRLTQYFRAQAYDRSPTIRYPRVDDIDLKAATMAEFLVQRVMDDGDFSCEASQAVINLMSSGSWILWYGIGRSVTSTTTLAGLATSVADAVSSAASGAPTEIPDGVDPHAVREVARDVAMDPETLIELEKHQRDALWALDKQATVRLQERIDEPYTTAESKVWFQHTPVGTNCAWDPAVWDLKHATWMARKLVMTKEAYAAEPNFTEDAKKNAKPQRLRAEDGHAEVAYTGMDTESLEAENSCYEVWEVWDKAHNELHYVCNGYDGYLEKDPSYPYLGQDGRPLLSTYWPCVVVTPMLCDLLVPERTLGIAVLRPGWAHQLEIIKQRSAAYAAAKRSARIYEVSEAVDEDTLGEIERAKDGTIVKRPAALQDKEMVRLVPTGPMPMDYLTASIRCMADFANAVGVSLASLTGEPVADTLGQEEIALQGASLTQSFVIRALEDGTARVAEGVRALVKTYFTDEAVASYIGLSWVTPKEDGQPSLYARWKASSLAGDKLECLFAARARNENAMRIKMMMDATALARTFTDSLGLPAFDAKPMLEDVFKAMGLGRPVPYEPSQAEMVAAIVQRQMAQEHGAKPGGSREAPGGGRSDGRKANGERGPAGVPNRQERQRAPGDIGDQATKIGRLGTA